MKKMFGLGSLCAAALLSITSFSSNAGSMNWLDNGVLVPYATFDDKGVDTLIRLRTQAQGRVFWSFFDSNGNELARDSINIQQAGTYGFVWSAEAARSGALGLSNTDGFLVFGLDSNNDGQVTSADRQSLGANALIRDTTFGNQLVYLPTLGINGDDFVSNPQNWNTSPIAGGLPNSFPAGQQNRKLAQSGNQVEFQYSEESNPAGLQSKIVIWSSLPLGGTQPMVLSSATGANKTIQALLRNNQLNILKPSALNGFDAAFQGDGYLRWNVPTSNGNTAFVFAFTIVSSTAATLSQSLMASF